MTRRFVTALVLTVFVGLFLVVSGLLLLFFQPAANGLFDLSGPNSLIGNPLVVGMGIRQLAIGLMIVGLVLFRQYRALGIVMILGALVPFVDFVSFAPTIGVLSALRHGATVPVVLILGVYLVTKRN